MSSLVQTQTNWSRYFRGSRLEARFEEITSTKKGLKEYSNSLTSLDLRNNLLTEIDEIKYLTQLTSLRLDDNKIISVQGLENLTLLTKLYLSCSSNNIYSSYSELAY